MKKNIFFICFFLFAFNITFAQSDSTQKRFRYEFGIDVSTILGGVLIPGDFGFVASESYDFPLTYRLYTPIGNVRAGFGVSSANDVYEQFFTNFGLDTLEGNNLILDSRIGLEYMTTINKRWKVYYGIDYEYSRYRDYRQNISNTQGYQTDWTVASERHGISPILGFRFEFNDRIGLQTELRMTYHTGRQTVDRKYIPLIPNPNNLPDDRTEFFDNSGINLIKPSFLILTVKM
jgi:hypothetical protein